MYSLLHSFPRAGQIADRIKKLKDIAIVASRTQRFLDETYGDSQYTLAVLHAYQTKTTASAHDANDLKYKESDESKDTPVPRPIEPASQHAKDDSAKGDTHEEYPGSNSNKRSRDEDLTISIDHGAIGADTFKNKKLKAEAPQPSSQAHLSSGLFLQSAATPSLYSDGINPAVVAMLLASSSGQRNINANPNQTGVNDFDINTRMAVN